MQTCIKNLSDKRLRLQTVLNNVPGGEIGEAMKEYWFWECNFVECQINEAEYLKKSDSASGERKAMTALQFASNCGVHPKWLQKDYKNLSYLFDNRRNRLDSAIELVRDLLQKRKK